MRITWVDNLKGLGMILILIGHSMFPNGNIIFGYVFSFHVALFFFLSGYVFNDKKHQNFLLFIKDKAQRLLIPYFLFNLIFFVFIALVKTEHHSFMSVLKGALYGSWLRGNDEIFLLNVSTWFLMALFITSIFYFLLNRYIKNKLARLIFLILLSIGIHYESLHYSYLRLPFSIEPALMASLFYGIGHIYKEKITVGVEKIKYKHILFIPVIIWINLFLLSGTNFSTNEYGTSYIVFLVSSILGITTWIMIAKMIPRNFILEFIGKNSIIILGMEFLKTRILGVSTMLYFGYSVLERSYIYGTIQVFLTLIVMIPIILIINKFFPFILGNIKTKTDVKNS